MERERRHLAASVHLHLAAAIHYFAEAGDVEMGFDGGHGGLRHGRGRHGALEHGDGGDGLAHGGLGALEHGDGDNVDEEELEWSMQDLYDLLLLLASFVPPAPPAYKAQPQDVEEGLAWTWVVAVTTFSVRVLGLGTSTRCLPTTLRVLLLTTTVVSEVLAAIYMMPATTLTTVGACFTVVLLLAAHLVAGRRRRRL